jgi:hypothetical protein
MAGSHPEIRLSALFVFMGSVTAQLLPFLRKPLGRFAQQPTHRPILFLGDPFEFCQRLLFDPNR